MKITTKLVQEINKLYKLGNNMQMVAEKVGLSKSTVHKYVWEPRKHGTRTDLRMMHYEQAN